MQQLLQRTSVSIAMLGTLKILNIELIQSPFKLVGGYHFERLWVEVIDRWESLNNWTTKKDKNDKGYVPHQRRERGMEGCTKFQGRKLMFKA